jgi:Ni/Co efflux regulator RcnB
MKRLMVCVAATLLGLTALASYAEEVKMTDQDRTELRQRVDTLRSENALGRTRDQGAEGRVVQSNDIHATRSKHSKKRHYKRTHARPSA